MPRRDLRMIGAPVEIRETEIDVGEARSRSRHGRSRTASRRCRRRPSPAHRARRRIFPGTTSRNAGAGCSRSRSLRHRIRSSSRPSPSACRRSAVHFACGFGRKQLRAVDAACRGIRRSRPSHRAAYRRRAPASAACSADCPAAGSLLVGLHRDHGPHQRQPIDQPGLVRCRPSPCGQTAIAATSAASWEVSGTFLGQLNFGQLNRDHTARASWGHSRRFLAGRSNFSFRFSELQLLSATTLRSRRKQEDAECCGNSGGCLGSIGRHGCRIRSDLCPYLDRPHHRLRHRQQPDCRPGNAHSRLRLSGALHLRSASRGPHEKSCGPRVLSGLGQGGGRMPRLWACWRMARRSPRR